MPVDQWELVNVGGIDYWEIQTARFRVPAEWVPGSNMFIAVAAPTGQGSFPAAVQGDPGDTPVIVPEVDLTVLEHDDPTPASSTWVETSPDTYQEQRTIHKGVPGDDGVMVLDLEDYGTPVAGKMLVVNDTADNLEYITPKVGDKFWPASIVNTPSGQPGYTLCSVAIPGQQFDWRPIVEGQTVVTGTGADVRVDILARLNDATSGNIVGRGFGIPGAGPEKLILSDGPPAGSATNFDVVAAGADAVIYLRCERQTGTDTFTTLAATTTFSVRVAPVP